MLVTTKRGFGESLLNTVRQVTMTQIPVVRPVAFKVGSTSNVITINDKVVEDMVTFISNVSALQFRAAREFDTTKVTGVCHSTLRASDLFSGTDVECLGSDTELLHSLADVPVEVVFRKCAGVHSAEENTEALESTGFATEAFVVTNSRHCNVEQFGIKKLHGQYDRTDTESFEVMIYTSDGTEEREVFTQGVKLLAVGLTSLQIS